MALLDDFSLDYTNKIINHDSGTTIYTGLAFYSEMMDLFDALNQMDDAVPISAQTPTQFTIINGWYISAASLEYIRSASIQTSGWTGNVIDAISYDTSGGTDFVYATDVGQILDGTTSSATGTIVGFDTRYNGADLGVVYVRPISGSFNNETEAFTVTGGSAAGVFTNTLTATAPLSGESIWSGFNTIGSLSARVAGTPDTKLYLVQDKTAVGLTFGVNAEHASVTTTNTALGSLGAIDVLVQTQDMGLIYDSVSNGRIQIFARQQGTLYDHFESTPSSLTANTPIPLAASTDINNIDGTQQTVFSGTSTGAFTVGEVVTVSGKDAVGIVRSVSGTNPNVTLQYFEIGDLDIANADALVGVSSGATGTVVTPTAVNAATTTQSDITITFGRTSVDLNNGNGSKDYSITIAASDETATNTYEVLQYRMRRAAGVDIDSGTTLAINGDLYKGIEVRLDYNGGAGAAAAVGEVVTGGTSGATGIVASATSGAPGTGYLMVTQLNGTFVAAEQATTTLLTAANVTTVTAIQSSKQGPLMTLAGGKLFGQTGVYISGLASADLQNFTLIADDGTTQAPPNTQSVEITSLVAGDSVFVIHRDSSGDPVKLTSATLNGTETNHNTFTLEINSADATTLQMAVDGESNASIQLDVPDGGTNDTNRDVVRVYDDSLDVEYRMRYSSYTGPQFTLVAVDNASGTLAAGGDTDTMVGTATTWDPDGTATEGVRVGDIVINRTDSEIGYVTAVVSDTELTTTVMTNPWASVLYSINRVPIALTTSDTAYVPFLDRIALDTDESSTIIKTSGATGDKSVIIRVRDGGASPIFPFEGTNTIGDSGLSTPATRTPDGIAT